VGVLMVKCPVKGQDFSTGIQIEEDSLARLPETMTKSRCPHCGGEHTWWTREARLVDAIPPSQWIEASDRP
jgi:hypothetical protein